DPLMHVADCMYILLGHLSRRAYLMSIKHYKRVCEIYARNPHAFDDVDGAVCRQQPACLAARGVTKPQADRRSCSGNSVQAEIALIRDYAARRLHLGLDDLAGVEIEDARCRERIAS